MSIDCLIAELRKRMEAEETRRKHHRYLREQYKVERMQEWLEEGDRETWLQDTLETEELLG